MSSRPAAVSSIPGAVLQSKMTFSTRAVSASPNLVWELVKNNNRFLKKGLNGTIFSTEEGNP